MDVKKKGAYAPFFFIMKKSLLVKEDRGIQRKEGKEMKVYKNQNYYYFLFGILILIFLYKCPFLHILGVPCMGCGMTRAMIAFAQLKWKLAFYYHPLFPVVIVVICYYILEKLGLFRIEEEMKKRILYLIVVCFMIAYFVRLFILDSPIHFQIKDSILYRIYECFK